MKIKFSRRFLCSVGAAAVALAMIVGGVFAWVDNSQHKTNVLTGGNLSEPNDVVLIEDFEEPDDWQEGDELKKEIWVKNTGDGQIYLRVQLKEYMEIAKVTYTYSEEYLLVDTDGKFLASIGTTTAALASFKLALENRGVVYDDGQIVTLRAYGDTMERFYLATDATTNINGKYGKRMLLDYDQADPKSLVDGVARGSYEETADHRNHPTGECLYTPHLWNDPPSDLNNCGQGDDSELHDGTGLGFHDYVEWTLGAPLITLSDWNGEPVAAWILDDTSDEGWAYWGEALRPGDSTEKLLESITLIKQPDGPFYYAIHVDMQAADLYQLTANFTGMPAKIEDSYRGKTGFYINTSTQTAIPGGKVTFKASWFGDELAASDVSWSVSNIDTAYLSTNTRFSTPGVLTLSTEQPAGKLLITAIYTHPGGAAITRQYVITARPSP